MSIVGYSWLGLGPGLGFNFRHPLSTRDVRWHSWTTLTPTSYSWTSLIQSLSYRPFYYPVTIW